MSTPVLIAVGVAVGIPVGHYYWTFLVSAYHSVAERIGEAIAHYRKP